jgi:hypothetical protein
MRRALPVLILALALSPARGAAEEVFEKAFSMQGVSRVSIENVNGEIQAQAWDRDYLKVRAVKNGRAGSEALKQTEIRVRKVADEIRIETVSPKRRRLFGFLDFGNHNIRVDYELWVPAVAETKLETCNGRVEATGFGAPLACDSVNGSIELKDLSGPVKATTVNGSLRLAYRSQAKKTHLETVNGSIEVSFDKGSSVRYDLETINGRIEAEPDFGLAVEGKYGPKEAKGSYNGGSEPLHCETVNGSIRLKTY